MFGFSVYLNNPLSSKTHDYLLTMRNSGFTGVFTSLNVPEHSDDVMENLKTLVEWCHNLDLNIVADVSQKSLTKYGIDLTNYDQISSLKLTGIRLDDGVSMEIAAKLSQKMLVALNASTLQEKDLIVLRQEQADFDNLEAWSNYYPRPETGLETNWFVNKNKIFDKAGIKTMAFIPGDGEKRGPLFEGLPTLERHRHINPLAAFIDLKNLGVKKIYVGDTSLSTASIAQFNSYFRDKAILLHVNKSPKELVQHTWHQRLDVARDVVRLKEGRILQLFDAQPSEMLARHLGTITVDNKNYLRYAGELEICKKDLPADAKINVIGQVIKDDLALVKQIKSGQAVKFQVQIE